MINDNQTSTRNTRYIIGPATEVVRDTDDILNIDTTLGVVNLTLPNIVGSGYMLNPRCIHINDVGLASDINNINIYSSGGDLINNGGVLTISTSGANAKCTIANQTEWAVSGTVVTPAGITGAGILNRVAKFTSATSIGNSLLFDNGVSVAINTSTPSASAIFQINSTTQGVAFPRMTTVQRDAIASPLTALLVYNTTNSRYEYYTGASWSGIGGESLAATLLNGNTTSGTSISVSTNDNISLYDNAGATGISKVEWNALNYLVYDDSGNALMEVHGDGGVLLQTGAAYYSFDNAANVIFNSAGVGIPIVTLATATTVGNLTHAALSAPRTWTFPNASGTVALTSSLPTTFYSGDGSTVGVRTVTLGGTLQFNHGAAGANGYFQLVSGGYVFNQTVNPGQFFEYNHNTAIFNLQADAAATTGIRATNTGGVNPDAVVEMFAGSNGTAYFNIGPTTSRLDFYVNNTGKYAGGILGGSAAFNGSWGFGTQPTTAAKVHILSENGQGAGTIIQSMNVSPAEAIIQIRDAANVTKLQVSATGITTIADRAFIGYNLGSIVTGAAFAAKGSDSSFASTHTELFDGSNNTLWKMMNNGNIGHNVAPSAGDRLSITSGTGAAGYNGAINISAANVADNGYGILVQGGTANANFNAFWADVTISGTGTSRAFLGGAGLSGATDNYGAEFRARNGSTTSIGVWGRAQGGDAVNPAFAAVGVQGTAEASVATNRRAGYFYSISNVNNGTTYGVKAEIDAAGTNAVNYGIHSRTNGAVATGVNYAGWFQADGGSGATNYAIVTNGGNVGFGTTTPSQEVLLHLVTTDRAPIKLEPMTAAQASALTPENGMIVYTSDTDVTFITAGFWGYQAGTWTKL